MKDDRSHGDKSEVSGFKYYAFISYSHLDEKWAKTIQCELEGYKLPNVVRQETGRELPRRLQPIFRDATDLGVGILEDRIKAELRSSKYLVVICSPHAVAPNVDGYCWVEDEVRYFVSELGRAEFVIPVMIEGTPEQSFVPSLKRLGCLALDASKLPKARIVNDIVAKMLDLRPDDLWRREQRRRRRLLVLRLIMSSALALACAMGIWYRWDWSRQKTEYFVDYVDRFGVAEGLFPLSREQLGGRGQAYRFLFQGYDSFLPGWRRPVLREVFCVNSFDRVRNETNVRPLHPATAGRRFHYDERSRFSWVEHLNVDGTVEAIYRYSGQKADMVVVERRGEDRRLGTVAKAMQDGKNVRRDAIGCYRLVRDDCGHVRRVECFRDAQGVATTDERGIHRVDYRRDGLGRVTSESWYSWTGQKVLGGSGVDEERHVYDNAGNLAETCGLKDGKPVSAKRYEYDAHGNMCRMKVKSLDPAFPVTGWSELRRTHDEHGEISRCEFFDAQGVPFRSANSRWERKVRFESGCLVEEDVAYFDEKGDVGQLDGVSRNVMRYDGNQRIVELVRYGRDGQLLDSPKLAAVIRRKFDRDGRIVTYSAIGADGSGWCDPNAGWSDGRWQYDQGGGFLFKTARYFKRCGLGTSEFFAPAIDRTAGASQRKTIYDRDGRIVSESLFEPDGKKVLGKDGWHELKLGYDRYGYLSELAFFGVDGKAVLCCGYGAEVGPVAIVRIVNDAEGNQLAISLFDADGNPMEGATGWATEKVSYDALGRRKEQSLFGAGGKPVAPKGGTNFRIQYEYGETGKVRLERSIFLDGTYRELLYDSNGKLTRDAFFSAEGLAMSDPDGVHVILYKRDADGREVKRGFLDVDGNPTLNEDRIAGLETTYNEHGAVVEERRFGVRGELVRDKNGVCIVRWEYDAQQREIAKTFYDTQTNRVENNVGVAGVRKTYDSSGNLAEQYEIDARFGIAKPNADGVYIVHCHYDDMRRVVKKSFLDYQRKPMLNKFGAAGELYEYDGQTSYEKSRRAVGLDGTSCNTDQGWCGYVREHDARGNVVRQVVIDKDGNPFRLKDGTFGWLRKYDGRNRVVEEIALGADAQPCGSLQDMSAFGLGVVRVCRTEIHFDAKGRKKQVLVLDEAVHGVSRMVLCHALNDCCTGVRFEDGEGRLVCTPVGFARTEDKFNELCELTERRWFDANGRPCGMNGVYRKVVTYERLAGALRRKIMNYNADGFPVCGGDGCALWDAEYDSEHRLVRLSSFDENGKLVCANGNDFAKVEVEREDHGLITRLVQLDAKGEGAMGRGVAMCELTYSFSDKRRLDGAVCKCYDARGKLVRKTKLEDYEALEFNRKLKQLNYRPIK